MKYPLLLLLLVSTLFCTVCAVESPPELTDTNFTQALEANHMVVVLFYTPNSASCDKLLKEYQEFFNMTSTYKRPYFLTQVNAEACPKIAANYSVTTYPALKIFKNGTIIDCDIRKPFEEIVQLLDRKAFAQVIPITVKSDLKRICKRQDLRNMRAFLVSDNQTLLALYKEAVYMSAVNCEFYHVPVSLGKKVFQGSWTAPVIFLIHPFAPDKFAYSAESFNRKSFEDFLADMEATPVIRLNKEVTDAIMHGEMNKMGIILYRKESDKHMDEELKEARKKANCKTCLFGIADLHKPKDQEETVLAFYLGITEKDLPALVIAKSEDWMLKKWVHKGPFNATDIVKFYEEWSMGKIARTLKSEKVPKENPGPVYKVVGKNFKKEVIEASEDVLVVFHSDWCSPCNEALGALNVLAEEFSKKGDDTIKFVKIKGTDNEVEELRIKEYPSVKFFLAGRKGLPVDVEYKKKKDLESAVKKYHKIKAKKIKEDL